jgi:hypothetical protein
MEALRTVLGALRDLQDDKIAGGPWLLTSEIP